MEQDCTEEAFLLTGTFPSGSCFRHAWRIDHDVAQQRRPANPHAGPISSNISTSYGSSPVGFLRSSRRCDGPKLAH